MKKKILIVAGAAIAVIGVVVCCILIQPNTPANPTETTAVVTTGHIHDYKITETVAATCQKEGYTVYTCECGASFKSVLNISAHEYELTKTEKGYEEFTCKHCKAVYRKYLDPIESTTTPIEPSEPATQPNPPHVHKYTQTTIKSATCKDKGSAVYTCSCGESFQSELETVDHKYNLSNVVEATLEQDGYEEYVCIYCGKSFRVPLTYAE